MKETLTQKCSMKEPLVIFTVCDRKMVRELSVFLGSLLCSDNRIPVVILDSGLTEAQRKNIFVWIQKQSPDFPLSVTTVDMTEFQGCCPARGNGLSTWNRRR